MAFTSFGGGVYVATGDTNYRGFDDMIVGASPTDSHRRESDGRTGARFPSPRGFAGAGVGTTAGSGGPLKVFDSRSGTEIRSFYAIPGSSGGVFVASADLGDTASPDVRARTIADDEAFDGVRVGAPEHDEEPVAVCADNGPELDGFFVSDVAGGIFVA